MKLKDLLVGLNYKCIKGNMEQEVDQIIYDSRIKTKHGLFIAIEGFQTDGHQYIGAAIENGAKVILVQKAIEIESDAITVIQTEDTRLAMALIATNAYGHPSKNFELVGVTGTNGKTSITFLLGQVLEAYHKKVGIIGTIENRIGNQILKAERTTPESVDLQRLFRKMADESVDAALMEVSSHALELKRTVGSQFKVGIFTNLTQDHLDFHKTMENYAKAKAKLFKCCEIGLELKRTVGSQFKVGIFTNLTQDHLDFHKTMENYAKAKAKLFKCCEIGIVNMDSDMAHWMTEEATCKLVTYGMDKGADYSASNIVVSAAGVTYTLTCPEGTFKVSVPIPGRFTVYNTLAVIAAARSIGIPMTHIMDALAKVNGVPGRVQSFTSKNGYSVLVDYAHTPDGLENVLSTIKEFAKGRVITVFGCGGDRDRTKRPIMGRIAAQYSDHVIITSDNPRTEDPFRILDEVEIGVKELTSHYDKVESREKAIEVALKEASKEDVVLIAGKGHENYQILKDRIIHFDDCEVVKNYLQEEE